MRTGIRHQNPAATEEEGKPGEYGTWEGKSVSRDKDQMV